MTKGEAYAKFGLNVEDANFNPDEVADAQFIVGCKMMYRLNVEMKKKEHYAHVKEAEERYGKDFADKMDKLALTMAITELTGSIALGRFVATLFDNGCPMDAMVKAIDGLVKQIMEDDDNDR